MGEPPAGYRCRLRSHAEVDGARGLLVGMTAWILQGATELLVFGWSGVPCVNARSLPILIAVALAASSSTWMPAAQRIAATSRSSSARGALAV